MKQLYSKEVIAEHVKAIGQQINCDYQNEEILLIVVLKGSMLFAADLCRELNCPVTIDFIRVSSYGDSTVSSGNVVFKVPLDTDIKGKNVIIVEDIIDTGNTLRALYHHLEEKQPASLKICTLIDKKKRRKVEIEADYAGIVMDDGFIIGYGLDLGERYRNLDAIYLLDPNNLPTEGDA
ncbi:MAG: hypoxanthine phosphoribosyltransferase [Desulfuromonas sp.]|nr:hypoxanthine phosphoribosyltransferase [Desulfuromonas sp.]